MLAYPLQADLTASLRSMRAHLPHALVLHGAKGLGKRALAQSFAHWLLCEGNQDAACGACAACHWLEQGNHPDLMVVEPGLTGESSDDRDVGRNGISVAQVREACDFLQTGAHRNGLRILLLYPAEAMKPAAANALLKTLEEPPAGALLLLVSHKPAQLLPTVRSRCLHLRQGLPDTDVAMQWLAAQGASEAGLCLNLAGGAPLLALELADADLQALRKACLDEWSAPESLSVVTVAARYAQLDHAGFVRWLIWLQQWTQDLLSVRMAGRIGYHTDYVAAAQRLALRIAPQRVSQFQQRLLMARQSAGHPLNLQMVLEDVLLDYNALFIQG